MLFFLYIFFVFLIIFLLYVYVILKNFLLNFLLFGLIVGFLFERFMWFFIIIKFSGESRGEILFAVFVIIRFFIFKSFAVFILNIIFLILYFL